MITPTLAPALLAGVFLFTHPAEAVVKLGTGNSSLLGGDLTDPTNAAKDKPGVNYGEGKSEDEMKPQGGAWLSMKLAPVSPPGSPPHQTHAYQSWQGTPVCKLFLNNPEKDKWYLGFKDGGKGGPTKETPYTVAVQLKEPVILTHFTITTDASQPPMPDRDPKAWAIQGSNTGNDGDWTDIYVCDPASRAKSPFKLEPRGETTLFTSFNSATIDGRVDAESAKKLALRLKGKTFAKPDFAVPVKAYSWYRIAIYSCFNPNSMTYSDFNRPPGCALAQMELFGVPAGFKFSELKVVEEPAVVAKPLKPPVSDLPFIIMPWVGVPKEEMTLERYKELAECGFNVSFPPNTWDPADANTEAMNKKYLDLCQQAGLKALLWDGTIRPPELKDPIKPSDFPVLEKAVDGIIARYSSHPALLGYLIADEPSNPGFPGLGVINKRFLEKDPKHLPYINLLPLYAFNPRSTYDEHVSKFIAEVKPVLVSWDHYRQMFEGGDESTYWANLEMMRLKCTEAGIPFNQIIVSLKHMGYRECSEVDLRWQVYTSLAFGSRGIQYFTYWFTKGLAWADAPSFIDKNGKRDRKYDYGKKINTRIAKLGPTLLKLVCTGAYCNEPMPPGGVELADGAPVTKIEGGRVVVGCFRDGAGKRYVFPVNRTFRYIVTSKLTLDANAESVSEVSQETGELLPPIPLNNGTFELKLQPGDGQLFLVNEKKK